MESQKNFLQLSSDSTTLQRPGDDNSSNDESIKIWNKTSNASTNIDIGNYISFTEKNPVYNSDLTDQLIEHCSNSITKIPKPGCYTITSCDLSKQGLMKIDIIRYHKYITHLNLSANYLTEIKSLGYLPFLTYLDVSQNLISKLLDFETPLNIRFVNYSYNLVEIIPDLSSFWSLEHLDVSHNLIMSISGLQNLSLLQYLDLSYNYINVIRGLSTLNITNLYLDNNEIDSFDKTPEAKLGSLSKCSVISISFNNLDSLKAFVDMIPLKKLNVSDNNITSLAELAYLQTDINLICVDLRNNPIQENALYEDTVIRYVKKLQYLDGAFVDFYKKGTAKFNTSSNKVVIAGHYNSILSMLLNMGTPLIDDHVSNELNIKVPIFILVGPTASRKRRLARMVQKLFPKDKIVLGISHTTRIKSKCEINDVDYHFISREEFNEGLENGKFITCVKKYGQYFGIREDELQKAKHGIAIIFITDLNAGLQFKERYRECKLIFSMPKSEENHRAWLTQHFHANSWISTYIYAYTIAYEATRYESRNDLFKTKKSSILNEIINYIELVHEGKNEYGEMSETVESITSRPAFSISLMAQTSKLSLSSKSSKNEHQTASFSEQTSFDECINENSLYSNNELEFSENVSKLEIKKESIITRHNFKHINPSIWLNASFAEGKCNNMLNSTELLSPNVDSSEAKLNSSDSAPTTPKIIDDNSDFSLNNSLPISDFDQPNCLHRFIEDQLKTRDCYISTLGNSAGLSYYTVFTDKLKDSAKQIHDVIEQCVQLTLRRNKDLKKDIDNVKYQKLLSSRINYILSKST